MAPFEAASSSLLKQHSSCHSCHCTLGLLLSQHIGLWNMMPCTLTSSTAHLLLQGGLCSTAGCAGGGKHGAGATNSRCRLQTTTARVDLCC